MEKLNKCVTIINHPSIIIHYKWVLFYFDNLIMKRKKNWLVYQSACNVFQSVCYLFSFVSLFSFSADCLNWMYIAHRQYYVYTVKIEDNVTSAIYTVHSFIFFFFLLKSSLSAFTFCYSISLRNMILMPVFQSCCPHSFGNLLSSHDLFENISIDRFMSFKRIESACFDIWEMRTTGFLSLIHSQSLIESNALSIHFSDVV